MCELCRSELPGACCLRCRALRKQEPVAEEPGPHDEPAVLDLSAVLEDRRELEGAVRPDAGEILRDVLASGLVTDADVPVAAIRGVDPRGKHQRALHRVPERRPPIAFGDAEPQA